MANEFVQRIKDLPQQRLVLLAAQLQERLEQAEATAAAATATQLSHPIAVVGVGCRLPGGVVDPESFWDLLVEGRDAVTEIPPDRWDADAFYDPDWRTDARMATKWGGFLDGVDRFDARLFGISPREAVSMDPQQRLLLEVTWQALERAGIAPGALAGTRTGVYVGISATDYFQVQMRRGPGQIDGYLASGSAPSVAAGRIAYTLGLHGPALSVDTACSSSLVALHLAVQALRSGQCDATIAAGVNVILSPNTSMALSKGQMMASDGRCKTFSAKADGFVRGEGCGVVVLKRLADAEADGDRIVGVIRGSAINQDGRSNGLTAPNGPAQEAVITAALTDAGLRAADVGYVEAHGTGTRLGDPIEVQALGAVLGRNRAPGSRLNIGSVKTNLGHLESAAGITGLIKAMLVLEHATIPPHCQLDELSPVIPWAALPIDVPTVNTPWPQGQPRFAGVSSFGFSGTNAHVVLEAPPAAPASISAPPVEAGAVEVLTLSAQSPQALDELAGQLGAYLANHDESLAAVCATINLGRDTFAHREAFVAASIGELRDQLLVVGDRRAGPRPMRTHVQSSRAALPVFLFTGQGAQHAGMGRELFEREPVFAEVLGRCDAFLRQQCDIALLDVMWGADDGRIHQTGFTQPAMFSLQVALATLWRSWGVVPSAVVGHSVGEYAAAHVAGLFSLEDGLSLIATRGRLMQALPGGGRMVAVFASREDLEPVLVAHAATVSIAAVNGPASTVISGDGSAVQAVIDALAGRFETRDLEVSHAFHSPVMDTIVDDVAAAAGAVEFHEPQVPIISNVFGEPAGLDRLGRPEYWADHVRRPVLFGPAMAALVAQGRRLFLEIGPQPTLIGMAARTFGSPELRWVHSLRKGRPESREMATSLATVWASGVAVDWSARHGGATYTRPILPTYPMQRERYWAEGVGPWPIDDAPPVPDSDPADDVDGLLYAISWSRRAHPSVRDVAPEEFLVPVVDVVAQVDPLAPGIAAKYGTARYDEFLPRLDELCAAYVVEGLGALGLELRPGRRFGFAALTAQLGIVPAHHRLLRRMLEMMTEDGWLLLEDGEWVVVRSDAPLPALLHARLIETYPAFAAEIAIVERCGTQLAGMVTGEVDPLQVLFPGGSTAQMERIYRDLPLAHAFNDLVGRAVGESVRNVPAGRRLRVLEIGAGSGATTDAVLDALGDRDTDYLFTDISPTFTTRARDRLRGVPSVRFGVLDASRDPAAQGFGPGSFDVIIAANVVHATPNLRRTLANVRDLLASGGRLVMLEATTRERFSDLTVGFTPGWWAFDDTDLRPDYALLDDEQWCSLLLDSGFAAAAATPNRAVAPSMQREAVIVASTQGDRATEPTPVATPARRSWLLIGDGPLPGALADELIASGDLVTRLAAGERHAVDAILRSDPPAGVVLAIEPSAPVARRDLSVEATRARHVRRIENVLGTVLGLLDAPRACPLWIVTAGAQDVGDGVVGDAEGATAWGFSHVVELEHPELRCRRIDVASADVDGVDEIGDTARRIVRELRQPDDEPRVALRGDERRVPRIVRAPRTTAPPVGLDPGASYVVSGGLRGIGLLVGGWLVEHGARNVVLFGRHDPDPAAIEAIERMRSLGAVVVAERADMADDADVRRVIERARALAPLRGVIHNAGALADAAVLRQDWAHFEVVFGPKVFGTESIVRHLDPRELDFLVLFASGAGVAGSAGQANHAAANAYLDATAARLRALGAPAVSIDWGVWTGVGAAADHGIDATPGAFSPAQGLAALGHVIATTMQGDGPAQVLVHSADWSDVVGRFAPGAEPMLFRDLIGSMRALDAQHVPAGDEPFAVLALRDSLRGLPERRQRALLRDEVRRLAARVLDVDDPERIELGEPLHDLGLDSLMAVELRNLLGTALGAELPATLLFEHPSVTALVDHLLAAYIDRADPPAAPSAAASTVASTSASTSAADPAAAPTIRPDETTRALPSDDIADLLAARLDRLARGDRS